jgi:hemerythrin-like domain-containing protein
MAGLLEALYDEHRSMGAVLSGMRYLVRENCERGQALDTRVLRAMLYYLDLFSERMHHPKGDRQVNELRVETGG